MKEYYKKLKMGYDYRHFGLEHVKGNMGVLLSLQPDDYLSADRTGKLSLIRGRWARCWWDIKNWLRLNGLSERNALVIWGTFIFFYFEVRAQVDKSKIVILQKKKLRIGQKIIDNLLKLKQRNWSLESLEKELDHYCRSGFLQGHVIDRAVRVTCYPKESALIRDVKKALAHAIHPILMIRGLSGTYIMRNTFYERVGIFKPYDEEIGAPNHPSFLGMPHRGAFGSRLLKAGVRGGECLHREVAASLVDKFIGFGIVPNTVYARFPAEYFVHHRMRIDSIVSQDKSKRGSFQEYVNGCEALSKKDIPFLSALPLNRIHPLFALDLIIGHLDRHFSNILFDGALLIAIDNGLSFPDACTTLTQLNWQMLPQAHIYFVEEVKVKVEKIDWGSLKAYLLEKSQLSNESLDLLHVRLAIVQAGLTIGLTPHQMVQLMTKENFAALKDYDATLEERVKKWIGKLKIN